MDYSKFLLTSLFGTDPLNSVCCNNVVIMEEYKTKADN